jgi:hypothetical protein
LLMNIHETERRNGIIHNFFDPTEEHRGGQRLSF